MVFGESKPLRGPVFGVPRKWPIAVATGTLVAGCAPRVMDATVAFDIPTAYALDKADTPSAARLNWSDFIQDQQLASLIDAALAYNRDIGVAAGRVAEARAQYRIQRSPLLPEVTADASAVRARTPAELSVTGTAITSDQFRSQLSSGWELDFWGKYDALRDAARDQFLAMREAHDAVATAVVTDVANRYLLEREYAERLRLAQDSLDTREHTLRIMTRRYETGAGSKLEVTQAATLLEQARTAYAALIQDRDTNRNALALLTGAPIHLGAGELIAPIAGEIPTGVPSDLLLFRPDLRAAELRLRAAHANVRAARAAFFPSITLTGAFGTASAQLEGLFGNGSASWSFAPALSLPLFANGRTRANLDLAEARRNTAIAEYERVVQAAFRDVSDALVLRRQLAEQIYNLEAMLDTVRERARLAELRYENGRSAYLEVLDAQRDLFDVEQRLVQLHRAYLASGVSLYSALGGNFAAGPESKGLMTAKQPAK
jgi:outer membrane protein, multidrug efflux system